MAKLQRLIIENFRSIGEDTVMIDFPENKPVILIGENNAGKSNVIRALELMFGEFHPKFKKLDDFDHFGRCTENEIRIKAEVQGLVNTMGYQNYHCSGFEFSKVRGREAEFYAIQSEDGGKNQYVKNELREELLCIVVNSEQNLNYQLSYTSKFTLLSKVTKAFHDKLVESEERVNKLKGLFENIKATFLEVKEFDNFNSNMSEIAGQMLSNMTHALKFDFSAYDPSNYFKTLKVHPVEEGHARAYEELGTGQQQILALSFAHAYAKSFLGQGLIFVIDEPEAHLHPLAQKWLAKKMFQMAQDGLQIVITSHSPFFINLDFLDGINLVRKKEQTETISINARTLAEYCKETGALKANEGTIIPFYSGNSTPDILNGFFANKVILVEGPTEEFALPILLESVGLDTLEKGIAIISVNGKGNLSKWWRFFTCYQIPTFVCFDNDATNDDNGNKRKDALKAIGIPEEELGNLLSIDNWNINDNFCVFGIDYEVTMRHSFSDYTTFETEERERLSTSKPILAREVAKRIVGIDRKAEDIGWQWFEKLAETINALEMK